MKIYNPEGKAIGELLGKGFFTSRVPSIHFYRKFQGYPISKAVIINLKANGCVSIFINEHTLNGNRRWRANIEQYIHGKEFEEAGFDKQLIVPLKELELMGEK